MTISKTTGNFTFPEELRETLRLYEKAMSGDMQWRLTPATITTPATSSAWSRNVLVQLCTASGDVHSWFNGTLANGVSIADTSVAGTASIGSTTLTIVDGAAVVSVAGNAAAWLATETDTLTVAQTTLMGYTVTAKTSVATFA